MSNRLRSGPQPDTRGAREKAKDKLGRAIDDLRDTTSDYLAAEYLRELADKIDPPPPAARRWDRLRREAAAGISTSHGSITEKGSRAVSG